MTHLSDTPDVLLSVFWRETQVFVQAESDVVSIQSVCALFQVEKMLFQSSCNGRLARGGQTCEPDRSALLIQQGGSLFVRDVARMESDVGCHGVNVDVCGWVGGEVDTISCPANLLLPPVFLIKG